MTKHNILKFLSLLLVAGLLFAFTPTQQAQAADIPVACGGTADSAALQAAIDGASDGDNILVSGTCVLDGGITVGKAVTLDGGSSAKIQVSGTGYRITMATAGATLKGFDIEKTDKTGVQDIIYIAANNVTISNNKIHGQFEIGDGDVSRAMATSGGYSGVTISNNEIYDLRQPAYISGVISGDITNNYTYRTKGWVLEQGDMTFTGNTWGTGVNANVFDIAILANVGSSYYTDVPAMSAANNNAFIEDQRGGVKLLTPVYVDASAATCTNDCGTARAPYNKIQDGIDRVIPGGTVHVAAGNYQESKGGWRDLEIFKSLNLIGAGSGQTIVEFSNLQHGLDIHPDATGTVLVQGIAFTKRAANANSAGFAVLIGETGGTFEKITLKDIEIAYASGRNLHFNAGTTYKEIVIEDSHIHHSDKWGACIAGPTDKLTVTDSDFTYNGKNDPGHGYGLDLISPSIKNVAVTGGHFDHNYGPGININSLNNAVFDGVSASHNGNFNGSVADYEIGVNVWDFSGSGSKNVVFKNSTFANNERAGVVLGNESSVTTGPVTIESSTILGNGLHGVITWFLSSAATPYQDISIHHNRIINSGTTLIGHIKDGLTIGENWWGCNAGFGQPGCSAGAWADLGSFSIPKWLTLRADDSYGLGASVVRADVTKDQTGADTGSSYLPALTVVSFTPTDLVEPDSSTLTNGIATTGFFTLTPGSYEICRKLDNETVCSTYTLNAPTDLYVDDDWASVAAGDDPDGAGPATAMGYDAFATIQGAINAAVDTAKIHVLAGTYPENLIINKALTIQSINWVGKIVGDIGIRASNVTLQGLDISHPGYVTCINLSHDQVSPRLNLSNINILNNKIHDIGGYAGGNVKAIKAAHGPDNVTIEGNQFYGITCTSYGHVDAISIGDSKSTDPSENVVIRNNTFANIVGQGDGKGVNAISINNQVGVTALIEGNTFEVDTIRNTHANGYARVIGFGYPVPNTEIRNNTFNVTNPANISPTLAVVLFEPNTSSSASTVITEKNKFLSEGYVFINASGHTANASKNWWGNWYGPTASRVITPGTPIAPWCADSACTKFLPDENNEIHVPAGETLTADILQILIDNAPQGTKIFVPAGTYAYAGGYHIDKPHLTLFLENGVIIRNTSPCFTINASNTIITTESLSGAKCVPTSGSNGIDVAANLDNIIIKGIQFDGTGETTGSGIHFAGAVKDIVLVDNFIHDLDGDGIKFAGDVSEIVNIQGNMFKNNAGYGINNLGANDVGAEYNSWGDVAGPTGPNGDNVSTNVIYEPFTHADIYLVSSGTPWANQVVKGQNITYTVMAHLVNVNAADFVLTYPAELTYVSDTVSGTLGTASVVHNGSARTLQFIGYNTANVTGDLPLFSVTFTGTTAGANKPLSFSYAATSGFGMAGYESSSNVYVNAMVDSAVTIIDLPTISSPDIQGYYLTGEAREFHVTADNPSAGGNYAHVIFQFNISADAGDLSVEYWTGSAWAPLPLTCSGGVCSGYYGPSGGFPMPNPYNATSLFRVTAAVPGSYPVEIKLFDLDTDPDTVLATYTNTAYVYDKPTVTVATTDQYLIVGEPGAFTVKINNPTTGRNYDDSVVFDILIPSHVVSDFSALSCSITTPVPFTWNLLPSLTPDGAGGVKARIAGLDGYFEVPPTGVDIVLNCSVTVTTPGVYSASGNMIDVVDKVTPVERIVSDNVSMSTNANTKPVITAVFPTGPYAAGVPVTLPVSITNPDGIPAPFELVFDLPAGTVINYGGTDYTCAATCPPIPVTLPLTPADFVITFDEAWTGTVGISLYDSDWVPADRLLADLTQLGVVVNGNFDITGTFSMQGNASRAGIPVTLTWGGTLVPYGPSASTSNLVSGNFSLNVLYGGKYTITTLQPRYLNVTSDLAKQITVAGPYNIPALILRGGNAYWRSSLTVLDNTIDTSDASLVGAQYGGSGSGDTFGNHGDCNFDGIVNIQDLALVGGNWNLTSAVAYTAWLP